MAEEGPNDFYRRTTADTPMPEPQERDADRRPTLRPNSAFSVDHPNSSSSPAHSEKLLLLFRELAAEDSARSDQDTRSISSTHVEAGDQLPGGDPTGPGQSMSGSAHLAVPGSRSITPMTPPGDQLLHGVGSCHDVRIRARLIQLEELYNEYQERFVSFRKDQACARLQAALSEQFGSDSDVDSFQLAVFSHDELCWSNGAERIMEEQAAICMAIERQDVEPRSYRQACLLPPGSYSVPGRESIKVSRPDLTMQEAPAWSDASESEPEKREAHER